MKTHPAARRRFLAYGAASLSAALAAPAIRAQGPFPQRPIRLIVGFPAGGTSDSVMRAAALEASKKLGQTIYIENKPGAAGVLSYMALKNAAPDGYTIGAISPPLWRQPILEKVAYDPFKDFTFILNLTENVMAIVVAQDAPFKSWAELMAYGRKNPDQMNYGIPPGYGQSAHLIMAQLSAAEHLNWQPIPYKGSSESIVALLGGQIKFAVDVVISTNGLVRGGKARYLAIAADQRLKAWPDVPTLKELGYAIDADNPVGIAAPAGTPPAALQTLHDAFKFALTQPSVLSLLQQADQRPRYMDSATLTKLAMQSAAEQRVLIDKLGLVDKR